MSATHHRFVVVPAAYVFLLRYAEDSGARQVLLQLREAGVRVDGRTENSEFGKFGWAYDPEGNKIELWQPPKT